MRFSTTVNKIKDARTGHCCYADSLALIEEVVGADGGDSPISLTDILNVTRDLEFAVWCLRKVYGITKEARLFACFCARRALPYFEEAYKDNNAPKLAIETAEKYARGETTKAQLIQAGYSAFVMSEINMSASAAYCTTNKRACDAAFGAATSPYDAYSTSIIDDYNHRHYIQDHFKRIFCSEVKL